MASALGEKFHCYEIDRHTHGLGDFGLLADRFLDEGSKGLKNKPTNNFIFENSFLENNAQIVV